MIVALLNYFKIRGEAYAYLRLRKELEHLLEEYLLGEILKRMHVRMLTSLFNIKQQIYLAVHSG